MGTVGGAVRRICAPGCRAGPKRPPSDAASRKRQAVGHATDRSPLLPTLQRVGTGVGTTGPMRCAAPDPSQRPACRSVRPDGSAAAGVSAVPPSSGSSGAGPLSGSAPDDGRPPDGVWHGEALYAPPSCVGCPLPWRSSTIGVQATASCRQRRAAEIKRTAGETAKEKFQQTNSGGGPCLHAEASGERRTHTGDVSPAPRSSCSRSFWSAAKRAADKRAADTRDAANRRRTTRGARRSGSANQGAQTERHRPRRRGMNRLAGEPDRTRCVAPRTSDPRRGRPEAGGGARQTVGSNHGFRASASASTPAKTRGGVSPSSQPVSPQPAPFSSVDAQIRGCEQER